jgi:DNA-binding SARP family transcriptional activator/Tfp pilus assembly protein PilF/TolB-like protein
MELQPVDPARSVVAMRELLTLGRVRLVADDGPDAPAGTSQPKRIALLTYLVMASARGSVRRDSLLSLFWPELGDEEGRRALRQALHYLRRVIGDDVFVATGDELQVRDGSVRCDAVTFEQLVDGGKAAEALALYQGDFFAAFHVDDASSEYEEWVDRTRSRLRRRASSAAWNAADASAAAGQHEVAIEYADRACMLEPDQESGWRRLMSLQDRLGDRAGALRTYDELAKRLEREFGSAPSQETTDLARRIRTSTTSTPSSMSALPAHSAPPAAEPVATSAAPDQGFIAPAHTEPAPRQRRRLPLMAAGIVAVAAIGIAVAASMNFDDGNDEPSLVAIGSLANKDRVVVADFSNLAGDSLLAAAITEAFRIDLSQSTVVRVLTPRQVASVITQMAGPPNVGVNDSLAREVAIRQGAKAIVAGSVAKVANAYTVNVQLLSSERGEVLAALRETAPDSSGLIDAVDRASKGLRRRIGESLRDLRAMPALEDETTASLPALRRYTEAQRLTLAGKRQEAIRAYEEAVAIDTGFASAWVSLGMAYGSIAEVGRATDALNRAIVHQQRLPFLERNFAVASHAHARREYDTAIDAYTRVLERYPDNVRAMNNLAIIYQERRDFARAESLFTRAAQTDSTIANFYLGIHGTQMLQGKFDESRRTLDLLARRFPENPIRLTVEIQDAAARQEWEEAERRAETRIAAANGDTLDLIDPYEALASMAMTQGRLAESERLWRTHAVLTRAADSDGRHLFGVLQRGWLELRHRDSPARALAIVDSALAHTPLDSVLPGDRPYDDLARFYAYAGRLTRARELLKDAEANDRVLAKTAPPERDWARGVIALADGRAAEAEPILRAAAEAIYCTICALPDLARVYEAVGKADAAVVVYERYLATPWFWRYEPDAAELGWSMARLASLYDARGDASKAAAIRGRLIRLWQRADAELVPVVADARTRLTPLDRRP